MDASSIAIAPSRLLSLRRGLFGVLVLVAGACERETAHVCERLGALCVLQDSVHRFDDPRWAGASADLDGDGTLDLAIALPDLGLTIQWGVGGARDVRLYPGGAADVALVDLDGDGDTDVLFIADGALRVLDNTGGRKLPETQVHALEGRPESLWVGALDGDAAPDAIVATSVIGGLTVFSSGLEHRERIEFGQDLSAVEVADVDADGRLDIVAADFSDSALYVVSADGAAGAAPVRSDAGPAPEQLQLLDLDGDGKLEAFTHGRSAPEIWLHAGIGGGAFAAPQAVASLDAPSSGFVVHRNTLGAAWLLAGMDRRLVASELDAGGGVVRQVMTGFYHGVRGVTLDGGLALVRDGSGFAHHDLVSAHMFTEVWCGGPRAFGTKMPLALGDFTQDGILDVAAAIDEGGVTVFAGQPDGQWQEQAKFATSARVRQMTAADVTGDGRPDLVLVDATPAVTIAVGQGDGVLVPGPPVPTRVSVHALHAFAPAGAAAVAVADERDAEEQGVDVLTFDGAGNLAGQAAPIASGYAARLASADVDGDGREELVALVFDGAEASLVIAPPEGDGWGPAHVRSLADLEAMLDGETFARAGLGLGDLDQDGAIDAVLVVRDAIVRLPDLAAEAPPMIDVVEGARGADQVAVAHVDEDGIPDIVHETSGGLHVALGTEDGEFRPQVPFGDDISSAVLFVDRVSLRATGAHASDRGISVLAPGVAPSLARGTASRTAGPAALLRTGDVDADGLTDVVVNELPDGLNGGVNVLWGTGEGPARAATGMDLFGPTGPLHVADLDGRPGDEIVVVDEFGFAVLSLVEGSLESLGGAGVDLREVLDVAVLARPGEADDIVVLGHVDASTLQLAARPRSDRENFDVWEAPVVLWEGARGETKPFPSSPPVMATADFDGDGWTDVALFAGVGQPVRVVWGDAGRAAPATRIAVENVRTLAVGDLDGDDAPELVVATDHQIVQVGFSGRSPGDAVPVTEQCRANRLVVADLAGDGAADIVCQDDLLGVSLVLRAPGRANARAWWIHVAEGEEKVWRSTHAAELDGDGILDLVAVRDGGVVMRLSRGRER